MSRPLAESVYVAGRFYAAGAVPDKEHAALITNPSAWGDEAAKPTKRGSSSTPPAADLFDPSADGNGLDEVNNHLANAEPDEVARVLALEAAGKKRKGILEGPYAPDPDAA